MEGHLLEFTLPVTDPEGDVLAAWVDYLPPAAALDPSTMVFSWVPGFESAGTYEHVTLHVSDGVNEIQTTVTFAIAPSDRGPVLVAPVDRSLREGDELQLYIQGYDPDGEPVIFSSALLPPGAFLDPNTGQFSWTPDYTQAKIGRFEVPFTVTSEDGTTTKTTTFTILNANGAPSLDNLAGWRGFEGQRLAFVPFAFDPDNPLSRYLLWAS